MCWRNTPRSAKTRHGMAAVVDARRHRHEQRSGFDGAGAGENQTDSMSASFIARAGVRGRRHRASAFRRRRRFDPYVRGALPESSRVAMRNAAHEGKAQTSLESTRRRIFCPRTRRLPERVQNAQASAAAIHLGRRAASATARPIWPRSTTSSTARTEPAKVSCAGARFLRSRTLSASLSSYGARDLHARQHRAGRDRRARRRHAGDATSTWCGCRPSSRWANTSIRAGWMASINPRLEDTTINGFPAASATGAWR